MRKSMDASHDAVAVFAESFFSDGEPTMKCPAARSSAVLATVLLAWCWFPGAGADTIIMKNGVQIEGIAGNDVNGILDVSIGGRKVRLRRDEIHSVEKNDKDGNLDMNALQEEAARQDGNLSEETGLDRRQRDRVLKYLAMLTDPDAAKVGEARKALIAMGAEMDLFPFVKLILPSYMPNTIHAMLKILFEVDPAKTQPLAGAYVFFPAEQVRGLSLELLAQTGSGETLNLAMRGMLDHASMVRYSACKALAMIKGKEATPLLLRYFDNQDLRFQNNVRQALSQIWSRELGESKPETQEAWETFWHSQEGNVPKTVVIETLEPLVPPGTHFPGC